MAEKLHPAQRTYATGCVGSALEKTILTRLVFCCIFLLTTIEATRTMGGLNDSEKSVGPNHVVHDHSVHSPHEIIASDAKSFLSWSGRVRRGLWEELTGEDEEEREEDRREARERNREREQNSETMMRQRCAPTCWGPWSEYGTCTDLCGTSGYQTSTRQVSPPPDCVSWVARYGCQGSSSHSQPCNRMCYNGGTPHDGWCSCTAWYQGTCCETRFCVEGGTELDMNETCSLCPRGTYRDAQVHDQCEDCPLGWTTQGLGTRSQDQCTVRNCIEHGTELTLNDDCQNCPLGYFRNASVHSACVSCPRHWITLSTGASNEDDCNILHCERGYEGSQFEGTCTPCGPGYYKDYVGAGQCSSCPSGDITSRIGLTSERDCLKRTCNEDGTELTLNDDCQDCPLGYLRNASTHSACVPCPRHWTTLSTGASSENDCIILHCERGYEGSQLEGTCTPCRPGYYKSYVGAGYCHPCPPGNITNRTGLTNERECFEFVNEGIAHGCRHIPMCCGNGSIRPECSASLCLQGSAGQDGNLIINQHNPRVLAAICTEHGTQRSPSGACENCPFGYFRNASLHSVCAPCPQHWTTAFIGASNEDDCSVLHCGPGYEGLQNEGACTKCALGYYKSYVGAGRCNSCPSGYATGRTGSTDDTECFDDSSSLALVIGGGAGALVLLIIIIIVAACCCAKRCNKCPNNERIHGKSRRSSNEYSTRMEGRTYEEIDSVVGNASEFDQGWARPENHYTDPPRPFAVFQNEVLPESDIYLTPVNNRDVRNYANPAFPVTNDNPAFPITYYDPGFPVTYDNAAFPANIIY